MIALLLMLIGHVFVFYSLKEPRYMFKRLSALMHVMTGKAVHLTKMAAYPVDENYQTAV